MVDEETGTGLFQYFIKVIPTIYTGLYGGREYTNQYTFTEKFRPIGPPKSVDPNPPEKVILVQMTSYFLKITALLYCLARSHSRYFFRVRDLAIFD